MAGIPRLNGIIRALENGQHSTSCFVQAEIENAVALSQSKYDSVVFEMEHVAWDGPGLRHALQFMLNRGQISKSGSLAPQVTPIARVPVNGVEKGQWQAKQALDMGCYDLMWPHISTADQAYAAIAACRYPRMKDQPNYEPVGIRGDGPAQAARYWGLSQPEYYERADVWPLDPKGEIFVVLQIEDTEGIANLKEMLKVPGIGAILIGEGDLSQELGVPRQYDHPLMQDATKEIVARCKEANVVVGHPHVEAGNVERVIAEGYRLLMAAPVRSYPHLDATLKATGRA